MAFDADGDFSTAIGTFSDTVSSTPTITPGNYIDCFSGSKVSMPDFVQTLFGQRVLDLVSNDIFPFNFLYR